jgi:hypothetical protein
MASFVRLLVYKNPVYRISMIFPHFPTNDLAVPCIKVNLTPPLGKVDLDGVSEFPNRALFHLARIR